MESFGDGEGNGLTDKSRVIPPYARRASSSPYLFAGRKFASPRGRVHDPSGRERCSGAVNDTRFAKTCAEFENGFHFPGRFLDRIGKNEINNKCGENNVYNESKSSSSKITRLQHDQKNNLQKKSEIFNSRFPVQLIGKLSLAEEKNLMSALIPWGDVEGNGKIKSTEMDVKASPSSPNVKNKFPNEDYHVNRKEYQSKLLTASVGKVVQWFQLKNYFNILFEVVAFLVDVKSGKFPGEKCLVVRDEKTGPSLLVTFYEIDRMLPEVVVGSVVRCIGRLTSRNCVHAFRVEQSSEQEKAQSHRLFFMSNLVAQEAKLIFSKK